MAAIAKLVERYGDFPLGGTDASVEVLADRLGTDLIVTLDRRHSAAICSTAGAAYHLLPDQLRTGTPDPRRAVSRPLQRALEATRVAPW